jgi:hypothetical protein
MPYFMYQNKKIFFEEYGTGTPLLLLHGNEAQQAILLIDYLDYSQINLLGSNVE